MTWSSQHYLNEGLALGIDRDTLQNAVTQIERVIVPKPDLPALLTLKHLARRTDTDYKALRSIISDNGAHYQSFRIRKRSGGIRVINVPAPTLMLIQRWIARFILNPLPVHHCSFAFKPAASILRCASRHLGARWLVKMDVASFFSSISEIQVYRVFRSAGYQPLMAFELTRLTTLAPTMSERYLLPQWQAHRHPSPIGSYRSRRIGYLPQGAPSSPMLSNLVMRDLDAEIESVALAAGLRYTRYSDDLTFSTTNQFDRNRAIRVVREVSNILRTKGLHPNARKTTIVPPGARKIVLGLLVDNSHARLPKEFRSRLRQHLYFLQKLGPFEHAKSRGFESVGGMYRHIRGLIDFAKMVEPTLADDMRAKFDRVNWIT
jgi:RNA-directed DNA polymerase